VHQELPARPGRSIDPLDHAELGRPADRASDPPDDTDLTWVWPAQPPRLPHPERWLVERQATPERAVGLLAALLQGVGVQPTLVLTSSDEQPVLNESNRSLQQFRRLLLALPDGTLLDPAERWLGLGQVSPELQGRPAMWVSPDKTWFAKLPEPRPGDNALEAKLTGRLTAEGELGAEATLVLRGLAARELRAWLARVDPGEQRTRLAARLLAGWGPRAVLEDAKVEGADDPAQELRVTLRYRLPGLAERQGEKLVFKLGAVWPTSQVPAFSADTRGEPVWLDRSLTERTELLLELPAGVAPVELPKGLRTEPAAAGQTMSAEALLEYGFQDGVLQASRAIGLNQRAFGVDFYPTLRAITARYLGMSAELLTLQAVPAKPAPAKPAPKKTR
jgi:hypothetical protein